MEEPSPKDRNSKREILWAAVLAAQEEHQVAEEAFDRLVVEAPDRTPEIERAGAARHLALQTYLRALQEFTQHVIGRQL
jgi:hypothetical protein